MKQLSKYVLSLLLCAVLTSCASSSDSDSDDDSAVATAPTAATVVADKAEEEEIEYRSFTEDELYSAIISELSAQRGQLTEAGENYFDLAFATRDLAIIERAVQFATVNNDMNAMLQLGMLWAEVSPENPQPHLMLSFQFLESGNFDQALSHMGRVIDLGGDIDFSLLSSRTGRLNPQARVGLIDNLEHLADQYPQQLSIHIALIQILGQNSEPQRALEELASLKASTDLTPRIVLLEAQLEQAINGTDDALKILRRGTRRFEDDKDLRLTYARLLIQNEEFGDAVAQFEVLVEQDPQDWETYFSLALLELEMERYDSAIIRLTRLIDMGQNPDDSQYYLAYVYEQRGQLREAIDNYRKVRIGTTNYLAAQQQATRFAIQLGELEEAHTWLSLQSSGQPRLEILFTTIESGALLQAGYSDEAGELLNTSLNKYPNDTDLLFSRVIYYDSISDSARSELDLRQIIRMQPDDSRALNHLGYMLADQTDRHEEALSLVERAIAISPDDPAILDSLAWAQYKLGRYDEALRNLRRAFAGFPDAEVASHLGEVLWMMGREDEALEVWEKALETQPDSELVKEAQERLRNLPRAES